MPSFRALNGAQFAASVVVAELDAGTGHEPLAFFKQKAMHAIGESLPIVVGRQEAAVARVLSETSSYKAMLETALKAQGEQALQEFTVTTTTTLSPANTASAIVVSRTPPLDGRSVRSSPLPLGRSSCDSTDACHRACKRGATPTYNLNREVHTKPELWRLDCGNCWSAVCQEAR